MPVSQFELCFANFDESVGTPSALAFTSGRTQIFSTLEDALDAARTPVTAAFPHPWIKADHLLLGPMRVKQVNGYRERDK